MLLEVFLKVLSHFIMKVKNRVRVRSTFHRVILYNTANQPVNFNVTKKISSSRNSSNSKVETRLETRLDEV